MIDSIGWAGTVAFAVASVLVAHKRISGLWWMLVGNLIFGVVGIMSQLYSLLVVSIMMGILDLYGVYCWSKDEN